MEQIIVENISTPYFITEDGKCYNSKTGKYLKGQSNYKNKYISFNLTLPDGKKKRYYAHRLVAQAYLPNEDIKKTQVNHKNGNVLDNRADNLEWVTPEENQLHAIKTELRQFEHVFCFNKDKQLVAEYKTIGEASKAIGISSSLIQQELNKQIKTLTGGFYWSREKEIKETKNYPNTGKAKPVNQYTLEGKFIMTYPSTGIAAKAIGVKNGSHIGECCRGKIKSYKGFVWRYVEDIVSPSNENQRDASKASQE